MCVLLTTAPSGNSGQKPPSLGGKLSRKEAHIHPFGRSVRRAKFDEAAAWHAGEREREREREMSRGEQ